MMHEEWMTETVKQLGMVAACIGTVGGEAILNQSIRDLVNLASHWSTWAEATTREGQMVAAEAAEAAGFFQPSTVEFAR